MAEVEGAEELPLPPGDSREQRAAEVLMIAALAAELGLELTPRRLELSDGVRVELDGATEDLSVLVEAWAHQGIVKSAQRNKILTDAFKLAFVARTLDHPTRLILLLSDDEAARRFRSGWGAAALAEFEVEIIVVELGPEVRQRIRDAQAKQYR
jgi:hypothetical protein